jgi:hypothetical protein
MENSSNPRMLHKYECKKRDLEHLVKETPVLIPLQLNYIYSKMRQVSTPFIIIL